MNHPLTEEIVKHIFAGLGIIPSLLLNPTTTHSLISKDFLLDRKLMFSGDGTGIVQNNLYGCQILIEGKEFKILLGDCTQDKEIPEFVVLAQLSGNPVYGLYLVCNPEVDSEAMIAVSVNEQNWMPCSVFLQATFLAAMEHLKDTNLGWGKCTNYQRHYELLLSVVNFHQVYCEAEYEGQEE